MDTAQAGKNHLDIQQFRARYFVSSDHPAPERVKERLDSTVIKGLPGTLSAIISRWFSPSDPGIWFIRHLALKVDVNAAWEREQVACCWAAQIARALSKVLEAGEDGQTVRWFPDRAAYLARFLVDLAEGHAWSQWYYQTFDGLRMLPVSAALRTAICEHPATGLAALQQLPAHQRAGVLQTLSTQDARRVLDSIAGPGPPGDETRAFRALWAVWETADLGALQTSEEGRNALRLYLSVCDTRAELAGTTLRAAALALLRLARHLASSSISRGNELMAALVGGDLPALYQAVGSGDADVMGPLLRCPAEWVQDAGRMLRARYSGQVAPEPAVETDIRHTPFGGIFLLLPFLDALPLDGAINDWPDADETSAIALVRFLILVKCCGGTRARQLFFDPLVRDLMGIGPVLSPAAVTRWQTHIAQTTLDRFLERMLTRQREEGAVRGQTLVLARIPLPGAAAAVLLDCQRGVWLWTRGYHPNRTERLVERSGKWLSQLGLQPAMLISDDVFIESLRSAHPGLTVEARHSQTIAHMAEADQALAQVLARLDKLPDDLRYLAQPRPLDLSRPVDLALSVVAQGVLRTFAGHLAGFAGSSLPYLQRNFLDLAGSVEDEPTRRVVRLGRPPLNLVLNITGMARQTYQLSWLDERPLTLFQEG